MVTMENVILTLTLNYIPLIVSILLYIKSEVNLAIFIKQNEIQWYSSKYLRPKWAKFAQMDETAHGMLHCAMWPSWISDQIWLSLAIVNLILALMPPTMF